jgi:uncharacterized protein (DUF1778 family)
MKRKDPEQVIEKAMKGITAAAMVKKPRKTARIPLRMLEEDKQGIERMADKMRLSVSDYLVALHRHAQSQLAQR